jgi:hypothetical protein
VIIETDQDFIIFMISLLSIPIGLTLMLYFLWVLGWIED